VVSLLRRGVVNLLQPRVVSFYRLRVVNMPVFSNLTFKYSIYERFNKLNKDIDEIEQLEKD
jgi:hypothetical protein